MVFTIVLLAVVFAPGFSGMAQIGRIRPADMEIRRIERDTARVMALISRCKPLMRKDSSKARVLADSAVLLARSGKNSHVLGVALLARAHVDHYNKNYSPALDYFQECVRVCETRPDSIPLMRALLGIGEASFHTAETDRAIRSFQRALPLAMALHDSATAAWMHQWLGHMWQWKGDVTKSMESYERALRMYEVVGNRRGQAWTLLNIGGMHTRKGDFTTSLRYKQQALKIAEDIHDTSMISMALGGIGLEYDAMHKYDEALTHFERCIVLRERLPDRSGLARTLELAGAISTNNGDYVRAMGYLRRSIVIADSIGDLLNGGLARHGISRNFRERGQLDSAIHYEKLAHQLYHRGGHRREVEFTFRGLSSLYQLAGNNKAARACLDSALQLATELNERGRIGAVYYDMAELAEKEQDYKRAYEQFRLYTIQNDSVMSQRSMEQINELTIRYETDKKEQQIALLEKDKLIAGLELFRRAELLKLQQLRAVQHEQQLAILEQEREIQELSLARQGDELDLNRSELALNRTENVRKQQALDLKESQLSRETLMRNAAIVVLLLVALVAVFAVRSQREKRRAAAFRAESAEYQAQAAEARASELRAESARKENEIQQAFSRQLIASQEQERKRIAGSLHDGIGQDLLIIKHRAMMAIDEGNGNTGHLNDILEISSEAIDDVRRLSRDLRPYQLERVGLTTTLRSMLRSVAESTAMDVETEIEDIDGLIAAEQEIDLYRVVQEGVNNIMKHAEAKKAEVRIRRMNGSIIVTLQDDGRGFDIRALREKSESLGLGLQGIAERVRILGGSLDLESVPGSGTMVRAAIPVRKMMHTRNETSRSDT